MADRFIDKDETKIYGEYAAKKIRRVVVGLIPPFDAGLKHVANELDKATKTVADAVAAAHDADTAIRKQTKNKLPALDGALDVLKRFSAHLDTHPANTVDRKAFFTGTGTVSGIGRSANKVLATLQHIAAQLAKPKSGVSNAKAWSKEISAAVDKLAPATEDADAARTARSQATPEVEESRRAWLQTYTATKAVVEGVLRLSGKLDLMPKVFHDLAVPSGAKVTAAPADGEPAPASPT